MNKEYIESLLRDEETVKLISKLRTQFSHIMTEFYFFRTFFEALSRLNISCNIIRTNVASSNKIKTNDFIEIQEVGNCNILKIQYDKYKLENDLINYNNSQGVMSFIESTHALIDIFVKLFD